MAQNNLGAPVVVTNNAANPITVSQSNGSGGTATALPPGRAAAASSVPVVLSNEDFARLAAVAFGGSSASVVSVPSATAATTLKVANAARVGLTIANDSTSILYVLYGAGTPSATNYTFQIAAKGTVSVDRNISGYTGLVQGAWAAVNGFAMVTEVS